MKRIILAFAAIAIAATMAAFTTEKSSVTPFDDAYFAFDYANHLPTVDNVQDPSKWIRVFDLNGCNQDDEMACKLRVSPSHYSGSTLQSSINIVADESAEDIAYVVSAEAVQILNKANP